VVYAPTKEQATVIVQYRVYDGSEEFWGNVQLQLDDGTIGVATSWQLIRI